MFFFSSRRRHTRSLRDWSSDVCSSDLDHPISAVLEAVDADVARVFATAARGMAESAEQRRALVLAIPALELVLRREEGIAAAGVDQVTRLDRVLRAVVGMHLDPRLARAALLDCHHLLPFAHVGAAFAR